MKRFYQKLVLFNPMISFSVPAMASDPTGLATFFIGLPSLIIGNIIVGIITIGYYYFPSQSKKVIGIVLSLPVLLFNLLVMFTDTLSLLKKELVRSNDTLEKFSTLLAFAIYPILCCLLGYFIYRLMRNKFKQWENS